MSLLELDELSELLEELSDELEPELELLDEELESDFELSFFFVLKRFAIGKWFVEFANPTKTCLDR